MLLWPLQVLLSRWAWTVKFISSLFPNWGAFRSAGLQWVFICSWGWLWLFIIRIETVTKQWWIFLVVVIALTLNGLYCQETWLLAQWEQLSWFTALFLEVQWNLKHFLCLQSSSFQGSVPWSRHANCVAPVYIYCWYSKQFAFLQEVVYSLFVNHTFSLVICASSPFCLKLQCRVSSWWSHCRQQFPQ